MTVTTDQRKTGVTHAPMVIASNAAASSITGTVSETTLGTVTIPAGALSVNSTVRIVAVFSYTNSANTKTPRIKFAGTTMWSGAATTTAGVRAEAGVLVRGQTSQILASPGNGFSASVAHGTASADIATAIDITFTGQLTNTGETVTLEGYTVEVLS